MCMYNLKQVCLRRLNERATHKPRSLLYESNVSKHPIHKRIKPDMAICTHHMHVFFSCSQKVVLVSMFLQRSFGTSIQLCHIHSDNTQTRYATFHW